MRHEDEAALQDGADNTIGHVTLANHLRNQDCLIFLEVRYSRDSRKKWRMFELFTHLEVVDGRRKRVNRFKVQMVGRLIQQQLCGKYENITSEGTSEEKKRQQVQQLAGAALDPNTGAAAETGAVRICECEPCRAATATEHALQINPMRHESRGVAFDNRLCVSLKRRAPCSACPARSWRYTAGSSAPRRVPETRNEGHRFSFHNMQQTCNKNTNRRRQNCKYRAPRSWWSASCRTHRSGPGSDATPPGPS